MAWFRYLSQWTIVLRLGSQVGKPNTGQTSTFLMVRSEKKHPLNLRLGILQINELNVIM